VGKSRNYNHLLHTIDVMVDSAVADIKKEGEKISCAKGCSYCCYLLVEISWEEATILAEWLNAQHPKIKQELIQNIHHNAQTARDIFARYKSAQKYMKPYRGDMKLSESVYDRYFYKNNIPCPFLYENACAAYEARPTPCRLHMVTSDSKLCSREVPEETPGYHVPEQIETLRDEVVPITSAFYQDGRWGQLGIMVEAALQEMKIK
jgi:uncharacterized protein